MHTPTQSWHPALSTFFYILLNVLLRGHTYDFDTQCRLLITYSIFSVQSMQCLPNSSYVLNMRSLSLVSIYSTVGYIHPQLRFKLWQPYLAAFHFIVLDFKRLIKHLYLFDYNFNRTFLKYKAFNTSTLTSLHMVTILIVQEFTLLPQTW